MNLPEENNRVKKLIDHYAKGKVAAFVKRLNDPKKPDEEISHQRLNRIFNIDSRS